MIHKHLVFNRRRSITMMLALAILCAVTAAAAPANSVIINGVSIFSQRYLLNDGVTLSTTGTLGADAMAHFDPNTGILTLHGYNGGRIIAGHGDLTIKLVGTNRVTVIENHSGMAIGIVGSSTTDNLLTITADSNAALVVDVQNEGTGSAHCIAHNTSVPMSLRISGLANVTTIATASAAEGIGAWGLFEILDQATLNVELHGGNLYGSWGIINWGPNGDPTLTVFNTAGKVLVDVSEATNDRAVCLISDSYQLLRVGNMTLKWHENGGEMALPQNFKYEKADFAVCKDQTKAVYRYGTPRDLRVTGGDIDGNVSVGIFNRNVQFLAGDVAGISANVPENYNFTNWTTTGGVAVANPNSVATTVTMPAADAGVTANWETAIWTEQPVFTNNDDGTGALTWEINADNNGVGLSRLDGVEWVGAGTWGLMPYTPNTLHNVELNERDAPSGTYRVSVIDKNGNRHHSNEFIILWNLRNQPVNLTVYAGSVTVAKPDDETYYSFYYTHSAASAAPPTHATPLNTIQGSTLFIASDVNIPGPSGTPIYVQIYKCAYDPSLHEYYIVAYGEAVATPGQFVVFSEPPLFTNNGDGTGTLSYRLSMGGSTNSGFISRFDGTSWISHSSMPATPNVQHAVSITEYAFYEGTYMLYFSVEGVPTTQYSDPIIIAWNLRSQSVNLFNNPGSVTVANPEDETGYSFFYTTSAAPATPPAYGTLIYSIEGFSSFTNQVPSETIPGPDGTPIYVQIYKCAYNLAFGGYFIVAYGEAVATPGQSAIFSETPLFTNNGDGTGTLSYRLNTGGGTSIGYLERFDGTAWGLWSWSPSLPATPDVQHVVSFTEHSVIEGTYRLAFHIEGAPVLFQYSDPIIIAWSLRSLPVNLTANAGSVTVAYPGEENNYIFWYTHSAAPATPPAYGTPINSIQNCVPLGFSTGISGPNGTPIYVQIYKVTHSPLTLLYYIVAYGEAVATPQAPPAYAISVTAPPVADGGTHTFAGASAGYAPIEAVTFNVTNTGNTAITALDVSLSGTNAGSYTLAKTLFSPALPAGGTTSFTLKPNDGLPAGTYTATATINDANLAAPYTFTVSFTVTSYSVAVTAPAIADGGAHTFTGETAGYSSIAATSFTISNTGTGAMSNLDVALSGANAGSFTLVKSSLNATLASGSTTEFTLKPNDALTAETYAATVTITDANLAAPYTFTVSFTVTGSSILYGDVDGNGWVNAADAVFLARHRAGWTGYETVAPGADVDGNGTVNAADSVFLARHRAGWTGYETLGK